MSLERISSAVEVMSQDVSNTYIGTMASQMGHKVLHGDHMCTKEIT